MTCVHFFEKERLSQLEARCRYCRIGENAVTECYVDGGVIGRNPSKIGGTWAFVHVSASGKPIREASGVILTAATGLPAVTNNYAELCAALEALEALPANWSGALYSDSQVTLGRLFSGWKLAGIPDFLARRMWQTQARLNWRGCQGVLLDGHPTQAQLTAGTGSRGHPVSVWNARCDTLCGEEARRHLASRATP